jgi:magnesium-protoporphyrin O-methyltransferase
MSNNYARRRSEIEHYFDRTAAAAWSRLTSDAPVSGVRATVRAGRDRMRSTLLDFLPADLSGRRLLDAGCGTGALAVEAARRGADVVAVDLSPTLVALARERHADSTGKGKVTFLSGDMLELKLGAFDHVVAMDSLIHYTLADMVEMIARLAGMSRQSIVFTFAPRTPALTLMHTTGKLFPRGNRSPAIVPHAPTALYKAIEQKPALSQWQLKRNARISSGFYISHAQELQHA